MFLLAYLLQIACFKPSGACGPEFKRYGPHAFYEHVQLGPGLFQNTNISLYPFAENHYSLRAFCTLNTPDHGWTEMLRAGITQKILIGLERVAARAPWRYSFVSVLLSFAFMLALFQPGFDTNDDAGMNMIAAGKVLTHQPDEHLVFTHAYIGLALKYLYTHAPRIPWYGLYLVTAQIVAHTIVGGLILSRGLLRNVWSWFAIWMMTVGLLFFVRLQFTTTAFLVGLSGLLLLWESMRVAIARNQVTETEPTSLPKSVLALTLAGIATTSLCVMIRWEIFQLLFVLSLPVLAIWLFQQKATLQQTVRFAAIGLFVFLCGIALNQAHFAYYNSDSQWAKFYDYNAVRVFFNDTIQVRYTPETSEHFKQVGWSENDLKMMQYWCFDDPQTYSYEQLQKVYGSYNWKTAALSPSEIATGYFKIFKSREVQGLMALTLAMTLIGLRRKTNLKIVAMAFGFSVVLLLGLTINSKILPPRVYLPIMAWPVAVAAWACLNAKPNSEQSRQLQTSGAFAKETIAESTFDSKRARRLAFCSLVLVIVGTFFIGDRMNRFSMRRAREIREFKQQIADFKPRSDRLYVMWATVIPIENIDPLGDMSWLNDFHAAMFGWTQNTPIMERMKQHYGVKNILRDWQQHPELVFLGNDRCFELFKEYSREHLHAELQLVSDERHNIYESSATYFRPAITQQAEQNQNDIRSADKQIHATERF